MLPLKLILHPLLFLQDEDQMGQSKSLMTLESLMIGYDKTQILTLRSCHGGTMDIKSQEWPIEQS